MKRRIGMIYPAAGRSEKEFERLAPEGVDVHITRINFTRNEISQLFAIEDHLDNAAELLAQAGVDIILLNCTAAGVVKGRGHDKTLIERIESKTHIPAMTTATAALMALNHFEAMRITLLTAYSDEITRLESEFLQDNGLEVLSAVGAGINDPFDQAEKTASFWYDFAIQNYSASSDAVFISCAGIKVVDQISNLEQRFNLPVITSNQAAMWSCLVKMKLNQRIPNYGRLLAS